MRQSLSPLEMMYQSLSDWIVSSEFPTDPL